MPKQVPLVRLRSSDYRLMVLNFLLLRDGLRCSICGLMLDLDPTKVHIDHIIPIYSNGPRWNPDNLRAVHPKCNLSRSRFGWQKKKCKKGHDYDTYGYIVKSGKVAGTRRCKLCKQRTNKAYFRRKLNGTN